MHSPSTKVLEGEGIPGSWKFIAQKTVLRTLGTSTMSRPWEIGCHTLRSAGFATSWCERVQIQATDTGHTGRTSC
jgi:hypothetical protein